jgi:hypothetical protein
MTPEVARREVAAARAAGWYAMTWDSVFFAGGGPRPDAAPAMVRPRSQSPLIGPVLAAVDATDGTRQAVTAAVIAACPDAAPPGINSCLNRLAHGPHPLLAYSLVPHPSAARGPVRRYALTAAGRARIGVTA